MPRKDLKVKNPGKRIMIIGATSGIGRELALKYLSQGCRVAITGRRMEALESVRGLYPDNCYIMRMDVRDAESSEVMRKLIDEMEGMDLMIYCAGIGSQNPELDLDIEINTVATNAEGFTRLIVEAYNYFKSGPRTGQIAALGSVAGTRCLRQSPSYSATKRYIAHYTACLAQKAHHDKLDLRFTTVIPGFIRTPMLKRKYPLSIGLDKGARLIFNGIERQRRKVVVPGRWRVIRALWYLIPERIWERL